MQNLGDGGQIRCIMGNVEVTNAREGALAVKWYDQSYESGGGRGVWGGGCQVVLLTQVVQVHLISDIIYLYVINCSLKFRNFCEKHTAFTCL